MRSIGKLLVLALLIAAIPTNVAKAWDPQPTNPFPGVAFGAEVPGYTVQVPCKPDDCGIGIVPVVNCPPWTAADGGGGFDVGYAKRFCRNSWTPPTSAADDEDFRNRQQLAVAAATAESQAWNAANPGLQKCVTWGPIVHANGISTASGGVCANPVGTRSDGTTAQVAPTPVSTDSSGTSGSSPASSSSSSSSSSSTTSTSTSDSATSTSTTPTTSSTVQQTSKPQIDLTQFGLGRPFTRVVAGNISASQCPAGFQAATNTLPGIIDGGATECWPDNAWAAYSIGGDVWTQFKTTNGNLNAQAEAARRVQVNAIRALALQQAQTLANQTPGIKRCNSWSGFGESGQECAFIPLQNNSLGAVTTSSAGDTSTSILRKSTEVVVSKISSQPGQTQAEWESTEAYKTFTCPAGAGRAISIDLNGTTSRADDVWTLSCVKVEVENQIESTTATIGLNLDSVTVRTQSSSESSTVTSGANPSATPSNVSQTSNFDTTTATIASAPIEFKGALAKIPEVVQSLDISTKESAAINVVANTLANIKSTSKLVKITLPNSPILVEVAKSLTPSVCKVSGFVIQPKKPGTCQITYSFEGESGNSFETTKKITFKK